MGDVGIGRCNLSRYICSRRRITASCVMMVDPSGSFARPFNSRFSRFRLRISSALRTTHALHPDEKASRCSEMCRPSQLDRGVERSITGYQNDHRPGVGEFGVSEQPCHRLFPFSDRSRSDRNASVPAPQEPHACSPCGDIMSSLCGIRARFSTAVASVVDNEYFPVQLWFHPLAESFREAE